ncbi:MAG: penicillin-binding transpeptidase domain-containing protein [Bacteriovoracaceae bacterium]
MTKLSIKIKTKFLIFTSISMIILNSCTSGPTTKSSPFTIKDSYFENMDACFLVLDLNEGDISTSYGEVNCKRRLTPCSSFKVPLSIMALDAKIITDEDAKFEWDGVHRSIESWNSHQTAMSWMKNSTVWVSQQITPQLGKEKIAQYLQDFGYGNQDISADISAFWLPLSKSDSSIIGGSLKISAIEQIEFMRRFWSNRLHVNKEATERTKKMMFLEKSPSGFDFQGKTGSGNLHDSGQDFGWFVGHIQCNSKDLLFVTTIIRSEKSIDKRYPGPLAKEITKKILNDNHCW